MNIYYRTNNEIDVDLLKNYQLPKPIDVDDDDDKDNSGEEEKEEEEKGDVVDNDNQLSDILEHNIEIAKSKSLFMENHLSFWNMFHHSFSLLLNNNTNNNNYNTNNNNSNNNNNNQSLMLFRSHPFGKKLIAKMYYNCRLKSIINILIFIYFIILLLDNIQLLGIMSIFMKCLSKKYQIVNDVNENSINFDGYIYEYSQVYISILL